MFINGQEFFETFIYYKNFFKYEQEKKKHVIFFLI